MALEVLPERLLLIKIGREMRWYTSVDVDRLEKINQGLPMKN